MDRGRKGLAARRATGADDSVHKRWLRDLSSNPPEGVPLSSTSNYLRDPHPITFGRYEGGEAIHYEGGPEALQRVSCSFYVPLEGEPGHDWGACTNRRSQYDGGCVFEHWTCKHFKPDCQDDHDKHRP